MKIVKKNIKVIIAFILGAIIFSSITTVALSIASKDVSYDGEKSNVQDAINDLYSKVQPSVDDNYLLRSSTYFSNSSGFPSRGLFHQNYGGTYNYNSNIIDVTRMKTLYVDGSFSSCYQATAWVKIGLSKTQSIDSSYVELFNSSVYASAKNGCASSAINIASNISNLSGEYYIVMQIQGQNVSSININDIWYD